MSKITFNYLTERFSKLVEEGRGKKHAFVDIDTTYSLDDDVEDEVRTLNSNLHNLTSNIRDIGTQYRGGKGFAPALISAYKSLMMQNMISSIEDSIESGEVLAANNIPDLKTTNSDSSNKRTNKFKNAYSNNAINVQDIIAKRYGEDSKEFEVSNTPVNHSSVTSNKVAAIARKQFEMYIQSLINSNQLDKVRELNDVISSEDFLKIDTDSNLYDEDNKSIAAILKNVADLSTPNRDGTDHTKVDIEENEDALNAKKSMDDIKSLYRDGAPVDSKNLVYDVVIHINRMLHNLNRIKKKWDSGITPKDPSNRIKQKRKLRTNIDSLNDYFGYDNGGQRYSDESIEDDNLSKIFSEEKIENFMDFIESDDDSIRYELENIINNRSDSITTDGTFYALVKILFPEEKNPYTEDNIIKTKNFLSKKILNMRDLFEKQELNDIEDIKSNALPEFKSFVSGASNDTLFNYMRKSNPSDDGKKEVLKLTLYKILTEYMEDMDSSPSDDSLSDRELAYIDKYFINSKNEQLGHYLDKMVDDFGIDKIAKDVREYNSNKSTYAGAKSDKSDMIDTKRFIYKDRIKKKFFEELESNGHITDFSLSESGDATYDIPEDLMNYEIDGVIDDFLNDLENSKSKAEMDRVLTKYMNMSVMSGEESYGTKYLTLDDINKHINDTTQWFASSVLQGFVQRMKHLDAQLASKFPYSDNSVAGEITEHLYQNYGDENKLNYLRSNGHLNSNTIYSPEGKSFSVFSDNKFNTDGFKHQSLMSHTPSDKMDDDEMGIILKNLISLGELRDESDNTLLFSPLINVVGSNRLPSDLLDSLDLRQHLRNIDESVNSSLSANHVLNTLRTWKRDMEKNPNAQYTSDELAKIGKEYLDTSNAGRGKSPTANTPHSDAIVDASRQGYKLRNESDELFDAYMGQFSKRVGRNQRELISENYNKKKYKNYNHWINDCMR